MRHINDLTAADDENSLVQRAHETVQQISHRTHGMRVRMLTGKYTGREAEVEGACIGRRGEILYCCYVLRADGSGVLNTDGASRSYHPADEFEVV